MGRKVANTTLPSQPEIDPVGAPAARSSVTLRPRCARLAQAQSEPSSPEDPRYLLRSSSELFGLRFGVQDVPKLATIPEHRGPPAIRLEPTAH